MGLRHSIPKHRKVVVPPPIFNPIVPPPVFYQQHGIIVTIQSKQSKQSKEPSDTKRYRIPQEIRNKVWTTYHGEKDTGICYCCGTKIERYHAGWHCSHVVALDKGGPTTVENLRTCCQHCNLSMGDQNLYVYIKDKGLNGPGSRNVNNYLLRHSSQINDKRTNNWASASASRNP